jgi:hypothetical protein
MTNSRGVRISSSILSALGLALALLACRQEPPRFEGLDTRKMPEEVRPDYALFAHRCSKCHSLSRPLLSGITEDRYWNDYVERMRRQPGSGISIEDRTPILRFLHYFSTGQLVKPEWRAPEVIEPPSDGGAE